MIDYQKMIRVLIEHFIHSEGTDYLGCKGAPENLDDLTPTEQVELGRLRDEARTATGWAGY